MARRFVGPLLSANAQSAQNADAGDCFSISDAPACLPGLINIGVQKAGTGELQTWLGVHPSVIVHGGEVHFFDRMERPRGCGLTRRGTLRLRYARYLFRRLRAGEHNLAHKLFFEKTPAYFDLVNPNILACAVPSARLLVMLREPSARAKSAYAMCQREMQAKWCKAPFHDVVDRILLYKGNATGVRPRASQRLLKRLPHLRRLLTMGHYAVYLQRWLVAFKAYQIGVIWLEQFKADPFVCMQEVERFAGLPHYPYRLRATRNKAGLYVVGSSKSTYERNMRAGVQRLSSAELLLASVRSRLTTSLLRAYYAPWQSRLHKLLDATNLTLVRVPPPPH